MDKNQERKVVEMVFGNRSGMTILESERPDFICEVSQEIKFGIEVTDFFLSESVARLRRIPNYAAELLTTKVYRHKDDRNRIRIGKVSYSNHQTGEEREFEALIGEKRTINDVVHRIKSSIEAKTAKSAGYSIATVDLIVRDVDSLAEFNELEELMRVINLTGAENSILKSKFREIYLLTTTNGSWVCVPLRANLFVAEVMKFQTLFKEYHDRAKRKTFSFAHYFTELARHLTWRVGAIEFYMTEESLPRLVFGSVAVGYGVNQKVEVVDISTKGILEREIVELNDNGDIELQEFVSSEIESMFGCTPILFAAH